MWTGRKRSNQGLAVNVLRYSVARLMWLFQCSPLWVLWRRWICRTNYMGGRRIDWTPVVCEECGWRGPLRWTWHTYHGCDEEDVEPVDECPGCGMEV